MIWKMFKSRSRLVLIGNLMSPSNGCFSWGDISKTVNDTISGNNFNGGVFDDHGGDKDHKRSIRGKVRRIEFLSFSIFKGDKFWKYLSRA